MLDDLFGNLDFSDFLDIGRTAVDVGRLGLGVANLINQSDTADQMRPFAQQAASLAGMMDERSPAFQQRVAEEEAIINRDFANRIRQLRTQNARQIARTGGMGFINPERADEAFTSALLRSRLEAQAQARNRVRQYLAGALGANNAAMGAFGQYSQARGVDNSRRMGGYNALLGAAGSALSPKSPFASMMERMWGGGRGSGVDLNNMPYPPMAPPEVGYGSAFGGTAIDSIGSQSSNAFDWLPYPPTRPDYEPEDPVTFD